MQTRVGTRSPSVAGARIAVLLMLPLGLAACGKVDRLGTQASVVPDNYDQRHPIVLATSPHSLDLFPIRGGLDDNDRARVVSFAKLYKERGRGPISVLLPQSGQENGGHAIAGIRQALARAGVGGNIRVGNYPAADPAVASPVRLTFSGLKAKVATRCGEWPDDLASASSLHTWQNKQYWNLGCSYQNMLAAQVADPRDLAGPQGESAPDVNMRMRAIGKVRQGSDPGTNWKVQGSNIGGLGGS